MKKIILVLFICIICSSISINAKKKDYSLKNISDSDFIKIAKSIISADKFIIRKNGNSRFIFYSNNTDSGYFVLTGDYSQVKGYKGPTSVALDISADLAKIKKCVLIESTDTKSYIEKFFIKGTKENKNAFFNQFANKTINQSNDNFSVRIDAVSGATITSRAISKSINETLDAFLPMIKNKIERYLEK